MGRPQACILLLTLISIEEYVRIIRMGMGYKTIGTSHQGQTAYIMLFATLIG